MNHLLRWKQELEVREIEDEYAYEMREFHQYLLADLIMESGWKRL